MSEIFGVIDKKCEDCINGCKNQNNAQGECLSFVKGINKKSLKRLNKRIKDLKIDLHQLCEDANMKYDFLIRYLKGLDTMNYKYYTKLMDKINEITKEEDWVEEHLKKYPSGFNESDTFYENQFIKISKVI